MPATELSGVHAPHHGLPAQLTAAEGVFVCRYTGEVFREYE
jgi:hypothetical protein